MIRKELLIDTIEVISTSHDGNQPIETSILIENVRYTKKQNLINDSGNGIGAKGKVYWDVVHSTPYDFKIGDRIKYQEEVYTIFEIVEGRSTSLHHKELYVR